MRQKKKRISQLQICVYSQQDQARLPEKFTQTKPISKAFREESKTFTDYGGENSETVTSFDDICNPSVEEETFEGITLSNTNAGLEGVGRVKE